MKLTLKVVNANGDLLASAAGQDEVILVYRKPYQDGDAILIESSEHGHVVLCLDEAVAPATAYMREPSHRFAVPSGERRRAYSPKAFGGDLHRIYVRTVHADQI